MATVNWHRVACIA